MVMCWKCGTILINRYDWTSEVATANQLLEHVQREGLILLQRRMDNFKAKLKEVEDD